MMEFVPKSAKPVGKNFVNGIEFYADQAKGRMVLIHSGLPGAKNLKAVNGDEIAVFRMVAKKAGETTLTFPPKGVGFTNARGEDEEYEILGGSIVID